MRLTNISSLLWAASATLTAASATGKVYVYDGPATQQTSTPETIDPQTARLIFAQRLDLSQFHTLSKADDEALRRISNYGGQQKKMFGWDRHTEGPSKVMIVVEGVEEPMIPALAEFLPFFVSPAPHPSDSHQLFSTFCSEAAQVPHTGGPDYEILRTIAPLSEMKVNTLDTYNNRRTLLYVKSVATASKEVLSSQLQTLSSVITNLHALAKEREMSLSIMFMPPSHKCSKRATNAYGLTKRAAKAQRASSEQILSESKVLADSSKPSNTQEDTTPFRATKVLTGAIPTCFSSKHSCETVTNNCTSHGSCILKWTAATKGKDGSISKSECYGCACTKPEVRETKNGKKTTNFGGPACNKKDIVMPFWLIGGSSVFLIFVVSWGVGLLYSMGSEELPSVIGAGVSGPKSR